MLFPCRLRIAKVTGKYAKYPFMKSIACRSLRLIQIAALFMAVFVFGVDGNAQTPEWIWHDNKGAAPKDDEVRLFRKSFQVDNPVTKAVLTAAGDDQATVFINGRQVIANRGWERPATANVAREIKAGENLIAVRGRNTSSAAAIIVKLELTLQNERKQTIVSDTSWTSSSSELNNWFTPSFDPIGWTKVVSHGQLGVQPWGNVMAPRVATAAERITVPPDFKVELIRSAESDEGSWVSMAIDAKGRLIFSPQEGTGNMLRAALSPAGQIEKLEKIESPVGSAMGLLYAFDSLYVSGNGPRGLGLYRLKDLDNDDRFDDVRFLKKFDGAAGEHGSHGLALGPDSKIYYMHGNFVKVPADISRESQHRNYAEDQLLPRGEDGNGFGAGIKPPGGFLVRSDAEGKDWELVAAGMRNAYDFDFNADGEMFTYDSDMEWDWGMPWYRPTRIYHLVPGGDYGFREGTGKFPSYYPDSVPPTLDISIGSPTGVKFGTASKYLEKYRKALYVMDWSYGRIFAVHLSPKGASYTATYEEFVRGKPLNVTDLEFGHDGAMYFLTGGRGTQSGLYRVSYTGTADSASTIADKAATDARELRRKLESFHGKKNPAARDFLWPHLNSDDRWIRYAARIALESQDVALWQKRALEEERVNASLTALLAVARVGEASLQQNLLEALDRLKDQELSEEQSLEALRILSLSFIRMGKPSREIADEVIKALSPLYPSQSESLNRELLQLLIYLEAPDVVQKTLALLEAASTQEEQIHYVFHLRTLKSGWTLDRRRQYFHWFNQSMHDAKHPPELLRWFQEAGRDYSNGSSFPKFIAYFRKDAVATLSEDARNALASVIATPTAIALKPPATRTMVKDWTLEDLQASLVEVSKGRSFEKGKEAFTIAQCAACHRFGNEGGAVGQDLTAVASRYTRRDILESILEPSKVISEQYQNTVITTKDGDDFIGRVVEENDQRIALVANPLTQDQTRIRKSDVRKREPSKISPMPEGLVNILTKEELLDLLAYLESGGKKDHAAFAR
ncbi:MAG: c-type cytochrome [Verrucomicrobia bacterium]|nr:c-type cytochrome [Verrucomicrobiota bacterium]